MKKNYLIFIFILLLNFAKSQIVLKTPNVESKLYLSTGSNQSLIVGLGGSEGGNAWSSDYWKITRDEFIKRGYAFLALGYFRAIGTPDTLNKISINDVYNAIAEAAKNTNINNKKIAIVGGSRGADLALLVASYFSNISCVVAIVPSSVVFPGHTNYFSSSAWTYNNLELPYVPLSEESIPYLIKGELRKTFEIMMKDTLAVNSASIKIENIKGPILFISATKDEIAPTTPMSDAMLSRLKNKKFKHYSNHIAIDGKHSEPLKHFDLVFSFLENYFKK
jgi:acetyl esterase/lipase